MTLYDELRGVLGALDHAGVEYALVGGLAVAVWGAPRATRDIDLLVRPEALPRALAALRTRGFVLEGLPFEFKDGTQMQRINRVEADGSLMTVDFLLVDKNTEGAWATRVRLPLLDHFIAVISREALIAMKASAARPQDLVDIANLKDLDR